MNETTAPITPASLKGALELLRMQQSEIEKLRGLVTRLTNVAEGLSRECPDPGTEALAAIHCGKNFIYG